MYEADNKVWNVQGRADTPARVNEQRALRILPLPGDLNHQTTHLMSEGQHTTGQSCRLAYIHMHPVFVRLRGVHREMIGTSQRGCMKFHVDIKATTTRVDQLSSDPGAATVLDGQFEASTQVCEAIRANDPSEGSMIIHGDFTVLILFHVATEMCVGHGGSVAVGRIEHIRIGDSVIAKCTTTACPCIAGFLRSSLEEVEGRKVRTDGGGSCNVDKDENR